MSILALKKFNKNKIKKITLIFSFVIGLIVLILFVVSMFYSINYNLLVIGVFLTINSIIHDNNKYYSKIVALNKDFKKPLEIKEFIVNTDDKLQLLKYLSPHYYSIFIYKKGIKLQRIEESELIK